MGSALGPNYVVTIVFEMPARLDPGKLADDTITFVNFNAPFLVPDNPFSPEDGHCHLRIVGDGNEINKGMRSILRCAQRGVIDHLVDRNLQTRKLLEVNGHILSVGPMSVYSSSHPFFMLPCILTIAGSDSSCGAGAQADIKTIAALGGYGLNAITSVVSESPGKVSKVLLLSPEMIADQIRVLFDAFPVKAMKTGMLGGLDQTRCVVQHLPKDLPLVVDPVMVATGGGRLLTEEAISAVKNELLPLATIITPNMDEAEALWGHRVTTREAMADCARELHHQCGSAVLIKGGHLNNDAAADVLWHEGRAQWFETPRVHGVHTHGTGCSYSAAIATGLGQGLPLAEAVQRAKMFVHRAIAQHLAWGQVHALNHLSQPA